MNTLSTDSGKDPWEALKMVQIGLNEAVSKHTEKDTSSIVKLLVDTLQGQRQLIIKGIESDSHKSKTKIIRSIRGNLLKVDPKFFNKRIPNLGNQSIRQCLEDILHAGVTPKIELPRKEEPLKLKKTTSSKTSEKSLISEKLSILKQKALDEIKGKKALLLIYDDGRVEVTWDQKTYQKKTKIVAFNEEAIESLTDSQKNSILNKITSYNFIEPLPHLINYLNYPNSVDHINDLIQIHGLSAELIKLLSEKNLNGLANLEFSNKNVRLYKKLVLKGLPITVEFFKECLLKQNLPLIKFILSQVDWSWMKKHAELILATLSETLDPTTAKMIFSAFPGFGRFCPLSRLKEAVTEGRTEFVVWMLHHGIEIDPLDVQSLIGVARSSNDLVLIKSLCNYAQGLKEQPKSFYINYSYPEILGLDSEIALTEFSDDPRPELSKILFRYALNSPLNEVYELVEKYPVFKEVLPDVMSKISLLVRLPKYYRHEIRSNFENIDYYSETSDKYASENLDYINQTLPKLNKMSREELLDDIVKNRFSRFKHLDTDYAKKTIDERSNTRTNILRREGYLSDDPYAPRPLRYYGCLTHLTTSFYSKPVEKSHSVNITDSGLTFTYPLPTKEGVKKIPLTDMRVANVPLGSIFWVHTSPKSISLLQDRANVLHRELLDYKLNVHDQENLDKFYEKVAEAYWLTATLCERIRGTPHNAMMYLNIIYAHHGLPPPIPKLDYFYPDNLMLMRPIEVAKRDWKKYFESPPPFKVVS